MDKVTDGLLKIYQQLLGKIRGSGMLDRVWSSNQVEDEVR